MECPASPSAAARQGKNAALHEKEAVYYRRELATFTSDSDNNDCTFLRLLVCVAQLLSGHPSL